MGVPGSAGTTSIREGDWLFLGVRLRKGARQSQFSTELVALYILVPGFSFICKPFQNSPLTQIGGTGAWEAEYDTGGIDEQATEIWAFLVTSSFERPCFASSLPAVDGKAVFASVVAHR